MEHFRAEFVGPMSIPRLGGQKPELGQRLHVNLSFFKINYSKYAIRVMFCLPPHHHLFHCHLNVTTALSVCIVVPPSILLNTSHHLITFAISLSLDYGSTLYISHYNQPWYACIII